jgi:crotonobetainyl-CoA:carnitine CoA-transferase CaiB-like acyl-CoA transferase
LRVLDTDADRAAVTAAVARWRADGLEAAIVDAGGCAATMRDLAAWAGHAQGRAVADEPLVDIEPADRGETAAWPVAPDRPLRGIRVLDLTRVLAGPVATRFLAGFGADVLRIDPPHWDEPAIVPEVTLGKRCARLDLRGAADRATFEALVRDADVLVHGYRPDALAGLGYDARRIRALRPGLVEVCHDAYGWSGPWKGRRGFDSLVQMSAGIAAEGMRRRGADRPVPLPVQALDHATGYLIAASAMRGLTRRITSGEGSRSRASLARTAAFLAGFPAHDAPGFADETVADLEAALEHTAWGPARRLRAPVEIEDCPVRWDLPACRLGSADARWQ